MSKLKQLEQTKKIINEVYMNHLELLPKPYKDIFKKHLRLAWKEIIRYVLGSM